MLAPIALAVLLVGGVQTAVVVTGEEGSSTPPAAVEVQSESRTKAPAQKPEAVNPFLD